MAPKWGPEGKQFFFSTMWAPGIELKSSGTVADTCYTMIHLNSFFSHLIFKTEFFIDHVGPDPPASGFPVLTLKACAAISQLSNVELC